MELVVVASWDELLLGHWKLSPLQNMAAAAIVGVPYNGSPAVNCGVFISDGAIIGLDSSASDFMFDICSTLLRLMESFGSPLMVRKGVSDEPVTKFA